MSTKTKTLALIGVLTAAAALIPLLMQRERESSAAVSTVQDAAPLDHVALSEAANDVGSREDSLVEISQPSEHGGASAAQASEEKTATDGSELVQSVRSAIEQTVYEQLDPNAMLDAALAIAELAPQATAAPFPGDFGELRFAIPGAPAGLTAEFVVGNVANPNIGSVLSLELVAQEPFAPYLVEGAVREKPTVNIKIWTDKEGKPTHLGIHSSLQPTAETQTLGIPLQGASITQGVGYTLDLAKMTDTMSAYGLKNGTFATWKLPVAVDGPWPAGRVQDIERLSAQLLRNYSAIQASYQEGGDKQ